MLAGLLDVLMVASTAFLVFEVFVFSVCLWN